MIIAIGSVEDVFFSNVDHFYCLQGSIVLPWFGTV